MLARLGGTCSSSTEPVDREPFISNVYRCLVLTPTGGNVVWVPGGSSCHHYHPTRGGLPPYAVRGLATGVRGFAATGEVGRSGAVRHIARGKPYTRRIAGSAVFPCTRHHRRETRTGGSFGNRCRSRGVPGHHNWPIHSSRRRTLRLPPRRSRHRCCSNCGPPGSSLRCADWLAPVDSTPHRRNTTPGLRWATKFPSSSQVQSPSVSPTRRAQQSSFGPQAPPPTSAGQQ